MRWVGQAAGITVAFAAAVAGLLRAIPGPHTPFDYLIVGTLATLMSLGLLFMLLVGAWSMRLFHRRPRVPKVEAQLPSR